MENFPKAHRFTIGERLTTHGLDLLTALVEEAYARQKNDLLEQASRKVNSTRYLLQISMDAYGLIAGRLDEIGRMVGGWGKAVAKP